MLQFCKAVFFVGVAVLLIGCDPDLIALDSGAYPCRTAADCATGYDCSACGTCWPEGGYQPNAMNPLIPVMLLMPQM